MHDERMYKIVRNSCNTRFIRPYVKDKIHENPNKETVYVRLR